jgi:hypothetical protein
MLPLLAGVLLAISFPPFKLLLPPFVALAPLLAHFDLTVHGQVDRVQLARPDEPALLARARSLAIKGRHRGNTRDARGPIADFTGLAAIGLAQLRSLRLEALRPRGSTLAHFLRSLPVLDDVTIHLRLPVRDSLDVLPATRARSIDYRNNVAATCMKEFLETDRSTLEVLQVDQLRPGDISMLQRASLPSLRTLYLRFTQLDDAQRDLSRWPNAPKLTSIVT